MQIMYSYIGSYVDGRDSTKKPEPYFHCGP